MQESKVTRLLDELHYNFPRVEVTPQLNTFLLQQDATVYPPYASLVNTVTHLRPPS
jgi:hypothetical protein